MHFYGYDWEKMMRLPLKLFWTFLGNMYRLQAQENLRWVQILSMPNIKEEGRNEYIQSQTRRMGTIQVSDERDNEGFKKLKNLQ